MKWIDTHAHTYLDVFEDTEDVVQRAIQAGVVAVILPNIEKETTDKMHSLESAYPDFYYSSIGLHPCSVKPDSWETEYNHVLTQLGRRKYIAIGEIGIDLYWDTSTRDLQIELYRKQLNLAKKYSIPAIIHSRDSLDLTISIAEEEQDGKLVPLFHCFNGTIDQGLKIVEIGGYMGLGGVVTYKNAKMDQVLPHLPVEKMILETDSPYLSPVPKRGKRNEPSNLLYIATHLEEILGKKLADIAEITTENARNIFFK